MAQAKALTDICAILLDTVWMPSMPTRTCSCTAPGSLDKRLAYAARLKGWSCQAARASSGLRWPFFSISHSAL